VGQGQGHEFLVELERAVERIIERLRVDRRRWTVGRRGRRRDMGRGSGRDGGWRVGAELE
jgi:hypothetical protein